MPERQIVTITMNPAIDKSAMVDRIIPEAKLHCTSIKNEAGGGGINVSKALNRLGLGSFALFPAGGHNGNLFKDLVRKEGIPFEALAVEPETRENFVILETSTNDQYRFNMEAAEQHEVLSEQCLETLDKMTPKPSFLIASGSLPGGIAVNFYARLAKWADTINAKFILDTSGIPLQLAVNERIYLLKPNISELGQLTGMETNSTENVLAAAQYLLSDKAVQMVVVSMGAQGALLVTPETHEFVAAPLVKKLSTVGAGDCMVAGMVYMLAQQSTPGNMLRFGIACGSAATMNTGTELFHAADVQKLYEQLKPVL